MKNILTKLHKIMVETVKVDKNGKNDFHKYKYLSDEDLILHFHKKLGEHGVMFIVESADITHLEKLDKEKGFLASVRIRYRFFDIESTESITGSLDGMGHDNPGDKAVYKAHTGAVKYIFIKTFLVPTKDDPESGEEAEEVPIKSNEPTYHPEGTLTCPKCGKQHTGKYPKCMDCYRAGK